MDDRADVEPTAPTHTSEVVLPVGLWGRIWLRLGVSGAVAAVATASAMAMRTPGRREYRTDIIGYPSYTGFDVGWYTRTYALWVAVFPLLWLGVYVLFGRVGPVGRWLSRSGGTRLLVDVDVDVDDDEGAHRSRRPGAFGPVMRIVFVSVVVAAELAVILGGRVDRPLVAAGAIAGLVACAIGAVAFLRHRAGVGLDRSVAEVLSIYVWFSVALLWLATRRAEVIQTDGTHVPFPFVAWWLATPVLVGLAAFVAHRLLRGDAIDISRRLVVYVAVPVFIFVMRSLIPGAVGMPDFFHDGERLVGADLLRSGEMPWRDFLAIHGLLHDSLDGVLAFSAFEPSWWGFNAGRSAIMYPLSLVSMYLLLAVLFERSWAYLTLCAVLLISGESVLGGFINQGVFNVRFILAPLVMAAFVLLLRRGTWPRAIAFSTLLFVQAVITPESAYFLPAVIVTLVVFELVHRDRSASIARGLVSTARCAIVGIVLSVGFLVFLAKEHAVDDYLYFFRTFASGHSLTGGIPITWDSMPFAAAVYIVPASVVVVFGYFVWRIRSKREMSSDDYAIAALAMVVGVYYTKFLHRGDGHVFQPLTLALPILFVIGYRLTSMASELIGHRDRSRTGFPSGFEVAMVAVLAVAMVFPAVPAMREWRQLVRSLPSRYRAEGAPKVIEPRLGFAVAGPITDRVLPTLRDTLSALSGDVTVFDFTNQPLLYHFLLDERPVTRFPHVSMAIRSATQRDLIEQLDEARPTVVAMNGTYGLPGWDGIQNTVRHYDVSEWILDRYRPWVRIDGQLLFLRNDVPRPEGVVGDGTATDDLYFGLPSCSWGRAAESLSSSPADSELSDQVTLTSAPVTGVLRASGWAVDAEQDLPADYVVAVVDGQVVASAVVNGARSDVARELGLDPVAPVAFDIEVPLVGDVDAAARQVAFVGVFIDGTARLLSGSPSQSVPASLDLVGRSREVLPGSVGNVDSVSTMPAVDGVVSIGTPVAAARLARVQLPEDHTRWDWLVIRDGAGLADGTYSISDRPGATFHSIDAVIAEESNRLAIQVGSCPQWVGTPSDYLYVSSPSGDVPEMVVARAPR